MHGRSCVPSSSVPASDHALEPCVVEFQEFGSAGGSVRGSVTYGGIGCSIDILFFC